MEIVYWITLFALMLFCFLAKRDSGYILFIAFGTFVLAAIFTTMGARNIGETIMRFSFIFWLVGILLAVMEYRKDSVKS